MEFTDLSDFERLKPNDTKAVRIAAAVLVRVSLEHTAGELRLAAAALAMASTILYRLGEVSNDVAHKQIDLAWANVDADKGLLDLIAVGKQLVVKEPHEQPV